MRKGLLGSIAALAAGAGAAWGQPPVEPAGPPVGFPGAGAAPAPGAVPGLGSGPAPAIMPPGNFGAPYDPLGLGPVGGFGPPPGPMYPMPGPYAAQSYQPAPTDGLGGAGGDLGYGAAPRWWVDGEYLLWFNKGQPLRAPLLTSSAAADAGILGRASTAVLVGQGRIGYDALSGMRLHAGFFGDEDRRFGFDLGGWFTGQATSVQSFGATGNSAGVPVLARPITDVNGATSALVLSAPGTGGASALVTTRNSAFSIEPTAVWNIYRAGPGSRFSWSLDFIAGYRFLELKEDLSVVTATTLSSGTTTPVFTTGPFGIVTLVGSTITPASATVGGVTIQSPTTINVVDSFRTFNHFNGGTIGLKGEGRYGIFTTSGFAKVSLGNLHQRLEVTGVTSFFDPGTRVGNVTIRQPLVGSAVGGVLANASNIGSYNDDRFTAIPEFGGTVGIALTRGLTGYVGINFLYLPDVIRPGGQAGNVVSSAAIPFSSSFGAANAVRAPRALFTQDDYWLGGVSFGLQLKY
ncbi:MAG TPA: BBP7 family outer membrane beta-barrel protein [Gemmata sp.]